jgi:hypothetical protein
VSSSVELLGTEARAHKFQRSRPGIFVGGVGVIGDYV